MEHGDMLDYEKWAGLSDRDMAESSSSSDSEEGELFADRPTLFKHFERYRLTEDGADGDLADGDAAANVIFDMPAEYYVNSYYNFTPSLEPTTAAHLNAFRHRMSSRKSGPVKDETLSQMLLTHKSQSTFVRPQLLLARLHHRKMFGFMRDFAIDVIERDFMHKIDVCLEVNRCPAVEQGGEEVVVPHRMFSWDYADFLERRQLENVVWIELLMMETDERCLEVEKFKIDLRELERHLKLVIHGLRKCAEKRARNANAQVEAVVSPANVADVDEVQEDAETTTKFDLGTDVLKVIADAFDYINIYPNLTKEFQLNSTAFREDINKSIAMTLGKRDSKERAVLSALEQSLMTFGIWSPIEMRYQLRHYDIMARQAEYRLENTIATYEEQIKVYTDAISRENYCSQCALNTFYQQIEKFKRTINDFQTKYNNEYEAIDNRITYKRMTLEKLRETRRFYGEELVRFRTAIARVRAQDAEVERQRQMALAELELRRAQEALEAEERKKRKGKGKKK